MFVDKVSVQVTESDVGISLTRSGKYLEQDGFELLSGIIRSFVRPILVRG